MKDKLDRNAVLKNKQLFEKLNAGDTSAMAELLINNMDLVEYQVEQFKKGLKNPAAANEEDLRQEAMISLFKLIKSRPIYEDFRFRANQNIQRSLETFVEKQNDAEAADFYYEDPIAPASPRLKDVATDEKSEFDMMVDREYGNSEKRDIFLCADDKKFLNMISYASPKEIAMALNVPEDRLIAIHEDIKQSILEQRASVLGFRYLISQDLQRLYPSGSGFKLKGLFTEKEISFCKYMLNHSCNRKDLAEHFGLCKQRIGQVMLKLMRKSRHPVAVRALQQSKDNSITK